MVKKILKNKFFILFSSFIIIVVTARFNPIFSLNERIIALSVGIEESLEGYTVILEAIKPSNNIGDVERFVGSGKSVELAVKEIENNSNKRVSFAQTEVVFLDRKLLEKLDLSFLSSDRLKNIPEVAVNVVTNSPKQVIYGKIAENLHSSHEIGSFIRKNKQNIGVLEVNFKDFARDYMSYLGCVTLPYIDISKTDSDIVEDDKQGVENIVYNKENEDKNITIHCNNGLAYSKNKTAILDYINYISFVLLKDNLTNNTGNISIKTSNNTINLYCKNVNIKKNYIVKNNVYIAEYEVYIDYFDNETYIMLNNDVNKKIKIDASNIELVEKSILDMLNNFIKFTIKNNLDLLHLFDEFYVINQNIDNRFLQKLNFSINIKLNKSSKKS